MGTFESYPRVTPFLWFNREAEQAADFYCSIFPNSRRFEATRNPQDGSVLVVGFELDGQKFTALNGGPLFPFTEAVSFVVRCDSQQDIDEYWAKLTADGGKESQCGWLKDKFGLSWQVVPSKIGDYASNPAAMQAMMGMKKLNIEELERAARTGTEK